jgi:hypothetical protein
VFLGGFSLFWLGRFVEQFVFLRKINHWAVHVLTGLFLLGSVLFALPIFL